MEDSLSESNGKSDESAVATVSALLLGTDARLEDILFREETAALKS